MGNWKKELLLDGFSMLGDNIFTYKVEENLGVSFHKTKKKGANLRELGANEFHQSSWESPYYKEIINKYLKDLDPKTSIVADLGCGDGRFTMHLIEKGFEKIIAIDAHSAPLQSLANYLEETGHENKVLLINSSLEKIPISDNILDALLAINVFYYLGDNQWKAKQSACLKLKKNGVGVVTEHNFEALLLRSLIFNDFKDFIKTFKEKKFKEVDYETPYWFPVTTENQLEQEWEKMGARIVDKKGISIFHQFLNITKRKNNIPIEILKNNKETLYDIFNFLASDGNFDKTIIYKIVKT